MEELSWTDWFLSFYERDYGPTLDEVMETCVVPLMLKMRFQVYTLIGVNIMYTLMLRSYRWTENMFHVITSVFGVSLVYRFLSEENLIFHFFFLTMAFLLVKLTFNLRKLTSLNTIYVTQFSCLCFILYSEIWYQKSDFWLKSRGLLMIAVMKIMSIATDIDKGGQIPSFVKYTGYLLCPANSIFGPWIKYEEYLVLRAKCRNTTLNLKWFVKMINVLTVATFHSLLSNCYAYYFIPGNCTRWTIAYRKAFTYRTRHYFLSYLSECSMIAAGFNKLSENNYLGRWSYPITVPADLEYPTYYATAVYSWNVPLLRFLKLNVYDPFRHLGRQWAAFVTLFFTCLIHGINGEIIFILFSFGGFAYFQSFAQRNLSYYLNICIKFRPCIRCTHKYTGWHILSVGGNLMFIAINGLFWTYMGFLVDMLSSTEPFYDTFTMWMDVNLTACYIVSVIYSLLTFLINLLRL